MVRAGATGLASRQGGVPWPRCRCPSVTSRRCETSSTPPPGTTALCARVPGCRSRSCGPCSGWCHATSSVSQEPTGRCWVTTSMTRSEVPTTSPWSDSPIGEPVAYDGAGPEHGFWGTFWVDVCSRPERTGDYASVTRLSDFMSERELRSGRGYAENLGPRGFLHETMVVWPDGRGRTLRILFFRAPGHDFDERDRFVLELVRPHLMAAYTAPGADTRPGRAPDAAPTDDPPLRGGRLHERPDRAPAEPGGGNRPDPPQPDLPPPRRDEPDGGGPGVSR